MTREEEIQVYREMRNRERQREEDSRRYVCAECSSPLVTPHNPSTGETELVCGSNREHTGHTKIRSWTQRYNDGEYIPVHVLDRIKKREKENHGK